MTNVDAIRLDRAERTMVRAMWELVRASRAKEAAHLGPMDPAVVVRVEAHESFLRSVHAYNRLREEIGADYL